MAAERVPLEASRPTPAGGLRECAGPAPSTRLQATILVKRRSNPAAEQHVEQILRGEATALSREEAAASLGADSGDLQRVSDFATSYGLTVVEVSPSRRSVRVEGSVAQMEAAFGVKLGAAEKDGRVYVCYDGVLTIPAPLAETIVGVLGLDQRPVATL